MNSIKMLTILTGMLAAVHTAMPAVAYAQTYPLEEEKSSAYVRQYVQIRQQDDAVVALRTQKPGVEMELGLNEQVIDSDTKGYVGGVLTSHRFLAISNNADRWSVKKLGLNEGASGEMILSGMIVLLVTDERAIGFDGRDHAIREYEIPIGESIVDKASSPSITAFATQRRVVVYDESRSGFSEKEFTLIEKFRDLKASSRLLSATTSERIFTFNASTGDWSIHATEY